MEKLLFYTPSFWLGLSVLFLAIGIIFRYWALRIAPHHLLDKIIFEDKISVDEETIKKFKRDNFSFYRKLYASTFFDLKLNGPSAEEKFNLKNKMAIAFKASLNHSKENLNSEIPRYQPIKPFEKGDEKGFWRYFFKKRICKISVFYGWLCFLMVELYMNDVRFGLWSITSIIMIVLLMSRDFVAFLDNRNKDINQEK